MNTENYTLDWPKVKEELLRRVQSIENALLECLTGEIHSDDLNAARRAAHQLAGSLGSFGLQSSSDLAYEVEQGLSQQCSPQTAHKLSFQVAELRRHVETSQGGSVETAAPQTQADMVLFLEPPAGLEQLVRSQRNPTLKVCRRGDLKNFQRVGTVVIGEIDAETLQEAVLCARENVGLRILALAPVDIAPERRLKAIRSGVLRFLQLEAEPSELLSEVVREAAEGSYKPRILALDDDALFLKVLRRLLEGQGMELETANTLNSFWAALNARRPDVIMLDLSMPEVSGQEMTLLLRADPRTEALPIILVTASEDDETRENLFAAGADDCIYKPVRSRELLFRIRNRLNRVRTLRALGLREIQAATLWPLPQAMPLLERLMANADQHVTAPVMALMRLPGDPGMVRAHLSRLAGNSSELEVLAHVNEDAYLMAFRGLEVRSAGELVAGYLAYFRDNHQVNARAGLCQFRRHGDSLRSLLTRAAEALEKAGSSENLVYFAAPEQSQSAEELDVLVVEDDSLLGPVVLQALKSHGFHCRWIQDGAEALEALTGDNISCRPRVIVLDVDLPGASGLEILRTLHQDKLLQRSRVIMLTLRANERETLETLALGAYDHLSKPASLPILVERVRLAMQTAP
jgi:DNA-binding response OmpR family regulator/HPt (histidine-containing phosphotransfer) domain-containing protein